MRTITALLAGSLLMSGAALADEPVRIAPISYGEDLLENAEDFGERELDSLSSYLERQLASRLAGLELADGTVLQVTIVDADPNRPTMEQLRATPGLSLQSISLGGAELEAELIGADGEILERFSYSRYSHHLRDIRGAGTWTDARRAMQRFSRQIGDAVAERAGTGS